MNRKLPPVKALSVIVMLLLSIFSYGQLPNFNLTVTPTPQTCLGNGSLSFTVTGNDPSASIDYAVYLLPNTADPVTVVTTPTVGGLVAGNYLVIATQSLGAEFNTSSANVTISNNIQPLQYTLVPTRVRCGNDGVITVNVTSGNAVSYEIVAGPVTVAPQSSNVLNNLPVGQYQVRVYDNCGEAVVVTTQVQQATTSLSILAGAVSGGELPSCDTVGITHNFHTTTPNEIFFPLTFQYTVYPPGGGTPTVVTVNVPNGSNTQMNQTGAIIPFYNDQQYTYDILVTDVCGNTFVRNNNIVNARFTAGLEPNIENCGDQYFSIVPNLYVGPYTISFSSVPDGFVPENFNSSHPTFATGNAEYGDSDNYVPHGVYAGELTDSCGRTAQFEYEITLPEVQPQTIHNLAGCSELGSITVSVPGRDIVSISITGAPDAYAETLPHDVSEYITPINNDGLLGLVINNLPLGVYTFVMTDSCGVEHEAEHNLSGGGGNLNLTVLQRAGCEEGNGSIRISSQGSTFISVVMTDAPGDFVDTPFDVSENIASNGWFFMNSLPEGSYTFDVVDECNLQGTVTTYVNGYEITVNDIDVIQNCGSFDINLQHTSNGNYIHSFWLQRYNEENNTWGHPQTGVAYTDGTQPTITNSIYLDNNTITPSLAYTGQFRIIKAFFIYGSGISTNFRCTQEIYSFTFDGGPVITGAYSFPCANNLNEVAIVATGVPPLTYRITTKNGEQFIVENANSNIFQDLETATYNFQVSDVCGNIRNIQFDINSLDPVVIEASGFCENEDSSLSVQPFSFLQYEWYEASNPGTILSTTNILEFPSFSSGNDAGTYIVNITSDDPDSCMNQTLEYIISPNAMPNAGEDDTVIVCNDGETVNLSAFLSNPHDAGGIWEDVDNTGALTGNTFAIDGINEGTYSFRYTVTGLCNSTDEAIITVQLNNRPDSPVTANVDPVCEGEPVQLGATEVAGAAYQWTGPNNFTSSDQNPLIANATIASSGVYTVTATVNGCPSDPAEVTVIINPLPQFSIQGNTEICAGQGTVLSIAPQNFNAQSVTYEWYHEGVLIDGADAESVEVFETGIYEVFVTNNDCEAQQSITVSENTNAFAVEIENGCRNYNYIISVANTDDLLGAVYQWSGPAGFNHTGPEADITNLATGEYTVIVTNADGCTAEASVTIDNTSCFIPRGISPNNDGMNDSFDLSNLGVKDIKIFNRYGLKVYEKQNYTNEWYGQSDKGDLPTGTYFYVITLSADAKVTGWVYLQREFSR